MILNAQLVDASAANVNLRIQGYGVPPCPIPGVVPVARAPALVRQLRPLMVQIPQALPDLYVIA